MNYRVHTLSNDKFAIVKKIALFDELYEGCICYARKLTDVYSFHPEKSEDGLILSNTEDEYTTDILDEKILASVQQKFPNARFHSSFIMFDIEMAEERRIAESLKQDSLKIRLSFAPDPNINKVVYKTDKDVDVLYMEGAKSPLKTDIFITADDLKGYNDLNTLMVTTYQDYFSYIKE